MDLARGSTCFVSAGAGAEKVLRHSRNTTGLHEQSSSEEVEAVEGRRICFPEAHRVRLEEFQLDESALGKGDVLLRTRFSLISPGTELANYTGLQRGRKYPFYPGYAAVGEVVKAGEGAARFRAGDLVYSYTRHSSIEVARRLCVKVPEGVEPEMAPFARMATIAMTALRVSAGELGDTVAVLGQGLVGIIAAQLFGLAGMEVIGIDPVGERLRVAESCGVRHTINPSETDLKERVMELTNGRGCEVTVEAIGNPATVETACQITSRLGEVILLGSPRGEHMADLTEVLNYVHLWPRGCLTLKGAHEWRLPVTPQEGSKHSIERNAHIAFRLIADGRLKVKPLLTHVLPPTRAEEAYEGLLKKKDQYLGVLFDWAS